MAKNVVVLLSEGSGRKMVQETCKANGLDFNRFEKLVQVEVEQTGKQRRDGLWNSFDDILDGIQLGK